jgi:hypothetical protein
MPGSPEGDCVNPLYLKGRTLKGLIEASGKEKADFLKTGQEIESYGHKADEKQIYDGLGLQAELWFRTTVAMTAQAKDLICPYLYPANPYRCGKLRSHPMANPEVAELAKARNSLMMAYLNYTPEETDLYGESVRAINQSQSYGAGVLWTGFNERKKLVHSVYDSIENLEVDPDASNWHEVNWVGRKRMSARWKLMDQFPQAKQVIAALKADKSSKANLGKQNDLISWYEVWMRVGLHRYVEGGLPQADENGEPIVYDDSPRKYVVSDDGKVLSEGRWETPLFMDDLWPCEIVSYVDDPDSIWPLSPMRAALPFQKALNWLYIFYMTKIRFCSRSLFAIIERADTEVSADTKKALECWDDMPFMSVRTSNDQLKIADIFQQLNLDPGVQQFEQAHTLIKREFQEHSGMYDILHYGESDTQDRSATTTQFKERTSKTRINYRLDRVIKWQSRLARKEALCARFLHTPEQIDAILGEGSGEVWGQLMPPQQASMDPKAVSFQQWLLETDYTVVSSSMRRHDIESKIEALKEQQNQVVSVQLQSQDPMEKAMAYDCLAEYYEAIGGSDELVQQQRNMAVYLRKQAEVMQQQNAAMQEQQAALQQQQAQADEQKHAAEMAALEQQHAHEMAAMDQKVKHELESQQAVDQQQEKEIGELKQQLSDLQKALTAMGQAPSGGKSASRPRRMRMMRDKSGFITDIMQEPDAADIADAEAAIPKTTRLRVVRDGSGAIVEIGPAGDQEAVV